MEQDHIAIIELLTMSFLSIYCTMLIVLSNKDTNLNAKIDLDIQKNNEKI